MLATNVFRDWAAPAVMARPVALVRCADCRVLAPVRPVTIEAPVYVAPLDWRQETRGAARVNVCPTCAALARAES